MHLYRKGSRIERELLNFFKEHGFLGIRVAGSGNDTPDLFVLNKGKQYIMEIKAHDTETLYIKKKQFDELREWEKHGVIPFVVWKRKKEDFVFIPIQAFSPTKKGNYKVRWSDIPVSYKKEDLI